MERIGQKGHRFLLRRARPQSILKSCRRGKTPWRRISCRMIVFLNLNFENILFIPSLNFPSCKKLFEEFIGIQSIYQSMFTLNNKINLFIILQKKMKKVVSLKSFRFKKQKDLHQIEASTQLTDSSDFHNSRPIFETPEKDRYIKGFKPSHEKVISRTSSVKLFKEPSRPI